MSKQPNQEGYAEAYPLDNTDKQILSILGKDARLSVRAIAREMNISAGQVNERIKKLEKCGIIRGYRVEVNPELAGFGIGAFVTMQIDIQQPVDEVMRAAMAIPEIEVAHWTTGLEQLLLTLRVRDYKSLHELMLGKLRQIPGNISMKLAVSMAHQRRVGGQFAFTWQDWTSWEQ
ncbi:hypothetical protein CAP48_00345 [Advenella sp. S44]|uniref:Lrp/AsnC family transcriptional regulator n=1 Tax=Advenella sp. S44 TaxID=1982755 RepID=UPI000C2B45B5|nr:Lrp/AsnC family transcriptional regulator [Advenella sp. S44]PJX27684.1 hypothetical protein CAP48_00345 [Advenella sp. S44]